MPVLYTNNAATTLASGITAAATSLTVASGKGALFPAPSSPNYFYATLSNADGSLLEIIKVTARTTDTFTVTRAQDGTTALAWNTGDKIELRITKSMLDDFKSDTNAALTSSNVTTALGYTPYNSTNPNGYISGNQSITVSGDASGSGATAISLTLASVGTAGTYTKVTTDAKGRITSGTTLVSADLPTYTGTLTSSQVTTALGYTPYNSTNPNGYTSNTGTVTSISGTGSVAGLSLSGTVTTSGNLTLSGTLSASIDNITDEHRLFNNMGDNHATRTSFDAQGAASTVGFGWRYVQGNTNGPNVGSTGNGQYYSAFIGLGNEYAYNQYGMQIAIPRGSTNPYLSLRFEEGGAFGAWQKISAGYADSAGNADTLDGNHASAFYLASNPSGYITGINSSMVTTALGYTPYNSTNPNGYITSSASISGSAGSVALHSSNEVNVGGSYSGGGRLYVNYNDGGSFSEYGFYNGGTSLAGIAASTGSFSGAITQAGNQVLHAGNYNSYSPTLTGTGASGTWGISITGNAANITGTYGGTLTSSQVKTALGYTPYNSTNPNGYITSSSLSSYLPLSGGVLTGFTYLSKTTTITVGASAGSDQFQIENAGTGGSLMTFHRAGVYAINMGLDTDNVFRLGGWSNGFNTYRWQSDTSGNFTAQSNVTAYSDERLKKDWGDLPENFVEQLTLMKHGTYTRVDNGVRQVGVSAQSLRDVLPEAVLEDSKGILSVAYGNAALVAAIKLAERVVELEARLNAMEAKQ